MKIIALLAGLIGGLIALTFLVPLMLIYWALGVPIEIKRSDKLIGTLQWFTYTKR